MVPQETVAKGTGREAGYDFPKNLNSWQRFAYDCAHCIISDSSSSYSSDSEDPVRDTAFESISSYEVDMPLGFGIPNLNPIDEEVVPVEVVFVRSETSEYELSTEITEGVGSNFESLILPLNPTNNVQTEGFIHIIHDAQSDSEENFSSISHNKGPNTTKKRAREAATTCPWYSRRKERAIRSKPTSDPNKRLKKDPGFPKLIELDLFR